MIWPPASVSTDALPLQDTDFAMAVRAAGLRVLLAAPGGCAPSGGWHIWHRCHLRPQAPADETEPGELPAQVGERAEGKSDGRGRQRAASARHPTSSAVAATTVKASLPHVFLQPAWMFPMPKGEQSGVHRIAQRRHVVLSRRRQVIAPKQQGRPCRPVATAGPECYGWTLLCRSRTTTQVGAAL